MEKEITREQLEAALIQLQSQNKQLQQQVTQLQNRTAPIQLKQAALVMLSSIHHGKATSAATIIEESKLIENYLS